MSEASTTPQAAHSQQPHQPSRPAQVPHQGAPTPRLETQVNIIFFCKDCYKIVEGIKVGRKYVYRCPLCKTKNVAFGSEKSIRSFYHVKDMVLTTLTTPGAVPVAMAGTTAPVPGHKPAAVVPNTNTQSPLAAAVKAAPPTVPHQNVPSQNTPQA